MAGLAQGKLLLAGLVAPLARVAAVFGSISTVAATGSARPFRSHLPLHLVRPVPGRACQQPGRLGPVVELAPRQLTRRRSTSASFCRAMCRARLTHLQAARSRPDVPVPRTPAGVQMCQHLRRFGLAARCVVRAFTKSDHCKAGRSAWGRAGRQGPEKASPARALRPWRDLRGRQPGSRSRTRTYDPAVNSRLLYRLSYPGSVRCAPL